MSESQESENEDQFRLAGVSAKQVASMELAVDRKTGGHRCKDLNMSFPAFFSERRIFRS